MTKNRIVAFFIAALMLICQLPAHAAVATEPLYENEYFVQGDFEGKSQIPGQSAFFGWAPYYSTATAVRSLVTKGADGDDAVYDGDAAIKFANTASSFGRGIYYDPRNMTRTFKAGETVEMSGWFRTDAPGGALINFGNGGNGFTDYNITPTTVYSEWTYVSGRYTFTEDTTNTPSSSPACFRINTDVRENYDADPSKSGYVYADNLSLRTVNEVWATDASLELTANESNALARVDYTYMGTDGNEEGATVAELQINDKNASDGWTTYKTIPDVNENNVKEKVVALDSGCAEKYLRAMIRPISAGGISGTEIYTDAVFVSKSVNIAQNPEFKWLAYGWTGGEYSESDEALRITSDAVYDTNFAVTADTGFNVSFDAMGSGDISVYVNDSPEPIKTQALTENFETVDCAMTVGVCDSMKLKIVADDALIDNLSIRPQLPEVYGVAISGKAVGGATVYAEYNYDNTNDGGKSEGETRIEWYLDGSYAGSGKSFDIAQGTSGVLTVKVTPVNEDGVEGNTAEASVDVYSLYVSDMHITASDYKTNGILVPSYKYHGASAENSSKLEWVAADSPDAPDDAWTPFAVYNSAMGRRGIPASAVTAANVSENGWLPLSQDQRGKYVAFRITPRDSTGREGLPTISEPTPIIEFERNHINNGNVSQGTKNFKLWAGAYSSENSTMPQSDDGSGSIFANGEGRKTAYDTHGSSMPANGGDDILQYLPAFVPKAGVKYNLSADVRMDYDENVSMTYSMLFVTSAGYTYQPTKLTNEWGKLTVSYTPPTDAKDYSYITVRASGDSTDDAVVKAGKILVDNLECYDSLPWVTNLSLSGSPEIGETLTAKYDFNGTGIAAEWNSKARWLVSDYKWGPWTEYKSYECTSSDNHTLDITDDLEGKYIRFEVTPQDETGVSGLEMQTTNEVFVMPTDPANISVEKDANGIYTANVELTNSQAVDRTIWSFLTGVKNVNGRETVCDIALDMKKVAANETADFSVTLNDNSAENARVIIAEGASLDKLRPVCGDFGGGSVVSSEDKNKASLNMDSKTVNVSLKSDNPNQTALVMAFNTDSDISDLSGIIQSGKIDGYIGLARTGSEKGGKTDFGIDGLNNGDTVKCRVTFRDGSSYDYSLIYDTDAAAKIVEALKSASDSDVNGYLTGTLIDGSIDMASFLNIDLTDYNALNDRTPVTSLLAGSDFTGRTSEIAAIVENAAKKQREYEIWSAKMDAFTSEIQNAKPDELRTVMNNYNDILNLNLSGKYGFAISLVSDADDAFCTELLTALKSCIGKTNEETLKNIRNDFDKYVAVAAVNNGPWNKMAEILAEHWSCIGLGTYPKYNDSSYDKTDMYKNIYNETFTGESADEAVLKMKNFIEQQINSLTKSFDTGSGSSGNKGGSGSVGGGSVGRVPSGVSNPSDGKGGWNFSDVDASYWGFNAITKCAEKGILRGYSDNSFRPETYITRAEFITILLRCAGIKADASFDAKFADVKESDWFAAAVYKAYDMGIVKGDTENSFAPNREVTREEMSVMVYRLYKDKLKAGGEVSFADAEYFEDWSKTAISAISGSGIVVGMGDGTFGPKAMMTRAMAAQIAERLISM